MTMEEFYPIFKQCAQIFDPRFLSPGNMVPVFMIYSFYGEAAWTFILHSQCRVHETLLGAECDLTSQISLSF